jgi:hypothetical protein
VFNPETIDKLADATKAVAETGNTAITAADSLGRIIRGPVDEIVGILTDRLKFTRWQRQQALAEKVEAEMQRRGLRAPTRDLPISFAVPLLTAAVLEEDDELQATWARLLVNAGDAATEMELRTAYIEILRGMSGYDVRNLKDLVETTLAGKVLVAVPETAFAKTTGGEPGRKLPTELAISLANLMRLGCVGLAYGSLGIYVTELGLALHRACS